MKIVDDHEYSEKKKDNNEDGKLRLTIFRKKNKKNIEKMGNGNTLKKLEELFN